MNEINGLEDQKLKQDTMADASQISDSELKNVDGGFDVTLCTVMICKSCGSTLLWKDKYVGGMYDCPDCGKHTLYGDHVHVAITD